MSSDDSNKVSGLANAKVVLPSLTYESLLKLNGLYTVPLVIYPADNVLRLESYLHTKAIEDRNLGEKIKEKVNEQIEKFQNEEIKLEVEKQLNEYKKKYFESKESHSDTPNHHGHHHHHHHDLSLDHVHHHHPIHVAIHPHCDAHHQHSTCQIIHSQPHCFACTHPPIHPPCLCDTNPKCVNCTHDEDVLNLEDKINLIRRELNMPPTKNRKHCPHEHFNA
jgi:hypothetical protein